jgi:hypothetical protein
MTVGIHEILDGLIGHPADRFHDVLALIGIFLGVDAENALLRYQKRDVPAPGIADHVEILFHLLKLELLRLAKSMPGERQNSES